MLSDSFVSGLIVLGIGLLGSFTLISVLAVFFIWWERKISGHIQSRVGPMETGWHGLLQTLADGIKLILKEDILPAQADKVLFRLGPLLVFVPTFTCFVALVYSPQWMIVNLDVGLFFLLAVFSLEAIGLILAGWSSNNKWSLYGAMRVTAQVVGDELPMGMALLGVVMLAGSLNLNVISQAQQGGIQNWFWFHDPFIFVAGIIFFIASLAAAKRAPFDLPEAESELVSGFHTEYSGFQFLLFFFSEYAGMFIFAFITSTVFLGGYTSMFNEMVVPGPVWVMAKSLFLVFVMMWLRWTLPRFRVDQVMSLCLKILLPLSFVCLIGTAIWQTVWPLGTVGAEWSATVMLSLSGLALLRFFYKVARA